jgi:ParB-like chromosome segregation protein Spo0J
MPRKKSDTPTPLTPPAPDLSETGETAAAPQPLLALTEPPTLLLLDPYEIQASEELNTRRFQTSAESIRSLASSMLLDGVQEPIGVTLMPDSTYLLRFGWRRWQAACLINEEQLGMGIIDGPFKLPAIVKPYAHPPKRQPHPDLVSGIVENAQRAELGPVDQAYAIQLLAGTGMSQRSIAQKMNISQPLVASRLRLLDLPATMQRQVNSGAVPVEVALRVLEQPAGPRREASAEAAQELVAPATLEVSDKNVGSDQTMIASDTNVSNKPTQTKEEKPVRSKTAKQMIVELEGYAAPEKGGRTPAQTWVLTKLIPWISKSSRPFKAAMEGLEKLNRGK